MCQLVRFYTAHLLVVNKSTQTSQLMFGNVFSTLISCLAKRSLLQLRLLFFLVLFGPFPHFLVAFCRGYFFMLLFDIVFDDVL